MEDKFEHLIQGLLNDGYAVLPNFLDDALTEGLRKNLLHHFQRQQMHPAGVGKHSSYQKNPTMRGDQIFWLDTNHNDPYENEFLNLMQQFVLYLNETCYTGINNSEFHYAFYEKGAFYKRHKDQFQTDFGRKFSFVTYLNEGWNETDGGFLALYPPNQPLLIKPEGGTVVFFKSNEMEHEVLPANRPRYSIAGWLKT